MQFPSSTPTPIILGPLPRTGIPPVVVYVLLGLMLIGVIVVLYEEVNKL
jgi:hypothetical protein